MGEAYAIWFRDFRTWVRLICLPTIIVLVAVATLREVSLFLPGEIRIFGGEILIFLVLIPMITGWHRLILIDGGDRRRLYPVGRREWRYLRSAVLLFVPGTAVVVVSIAIAMKSGIGILGSGWMLADAWMLISLVLFAYFLVAFLPVLPAAAIARDLSFREAFQFTRGQRWRMMLVYILAMVPVIGTSIVAGYLTRSADADLNPYVWAYLAPLADYAMTLIALPPMIAVASICCRELVQKPEATGVNVA